MQKKAPTQTYPGRQKRNRLKFPQKAEINEKRFIRNHNAYTLRHEIRELINELKNSIPGVPNQERCDRIILQDFLSFITRNPSLKISKSQQEATEDTRFLVTSPCPSSPEPNPPEQNQQVQTYTWPSLPLLNTDEYKLQTVSNEELYPADDSPISPMMKAVSPQEIFQWAPCQQMQDNDWFSVSSSPIQPAPSSENQTTPVCCQQATPEEKGSALHDMTKTLPLASEILQPPLKNAQLITYLNNQVADLQKSQANLEHHQIQTKNFLDEVLNKNQELSRKVYNLET